MNLQLKTRLRKLRGLPPRVMLSLFRYKAAKFWGQTAQFLRICVLRNLVRWPAHLGRTLGFRQDISFFGLDEWRGYKEELARLLGEDLGVSAKAICDEADQACAHIFDLLGSGPVYLGEDIDWHRDFKSGARWDKKYFKRIKEVELNDSSDIKVPWELSRCYYFVKLGMAYWLSGDEKYTREYLRQCSHWMRENRPYYGVNWHCSMEVAIRAVNWIWAYYFFRESPLLDADMEKQLARSLAVHAEYIWNNLEFDKRVMNGEHVRQNGNHYIADLVGLVYLGLVLRTSEAPKWLAKGLKELEEELSIQVLSDGVHWELSPSYHRLVLEMVLSTVILCSRNQVQVSPRTLAKLTEMLAFTQHYLKPNGLCPLVRDADDGRMCRLDSNDYRDHRHLLALGGTFFERSDFLGQGKACMEDVVWMLGKTGIRKARSLSAIASQVQSKPFQESGFYVLRKESDIQLFVACAGIGMKGHYGGHAHNDCLSFELYFSGNTFITDCGSYIYSGDPDARNQFRATASHNTARVDGCEMNRISRDILFGMENDARPKVTKWIETPEFDFLSAAHHGYQRLPDPITHKRNFFLDKIFKNLIIEDNFDGAGEHLIEVFFHFSPDVDVVRLSEYCYAARSSGSSILLSLQGNSDWNVELTYGSVSERYGKKCAARTLTASSRCAAPATLTTAIRLGVGSDSEACHSGAFAETMNRYVGLVAK